MAALPRMVMVVEEGRMVGGDWWCTTTTLHGGGGSHGEAGRWLALGHGGQPSQPEVTVVATVQCCTVLRRHLSVG